MLFMRPNVSMKTIRIRYKCLKRFSITPVSPARGRSEHVRACARKRMHKISACFGACGYALEVENISTCTACP